MCTGMMPRNLTQHTLACLTRQGAEHLAARRVLVNMLEGKMLAEFEAGDRETLEAWLAAESFHNDWILRIEYESHDGRLEAV